MASFPLRRNSDFDTPAAESAQRLEPGQMVNVPLGTLIYRAGLLSQEEVQEALAESIRTEKMLGEVLLERGMVEERELGRLLAGQKGLPFVELDRIQIDEDVARRLPEEVAREHAALPLAVDPTGTPLVAVVNPDASVVTAITSALGVEPHVGVAARGELLRAIDGVFGAPEAEEASEQAPEQSGLRLAEVAPAQVESYDVAPMPAVVEDVEPWETAAPVEGIELRIETEADEADVEVQSDFSMPTASTAEAEPAEDEGMSDDGSSDSFDDSPAFPWDARDDETFGASVDEHTPVVETFGSHAEAAVEEPPEQADEDGGYVVEEEPVLALVTAGEDVSQAEASFGDTLLAFPTQVVETETEHQSTGADTGGDAGSFEPDASAVEVGDETAVAAHDDDEFEAVSQDEVPVTDLYVEAEPAVHDEPTVDEFAFEPDGTDEDSDDDLAAVAEAAESEVAVEVFVTLSNGERLSTGRFGKNEEATSHALSLIADVKRNWWPQVDGRLIRPDAILSIDIEHATDE